MFWLGCYIFQAYSFQTEHAFSTQYSSVLTLKSPQMCVCVCARVWFVVF